MVRNYVRKTDRGTQYSQHDLLTAVEEVKAGRLSAYRASKIYKIPVQTISDHVKGRRGKSVTQGRCTVFTQKEEQGIAAGLVEMERFGFGLSREEILNLIKEFVISNKKVTPFKDSRPSTEWLASSMSRNRLSLKKPQSVEIARRNCMDPFIIYGYYDKLFETIISLGLQEKPDLIFNLDETSFCRDPSKTKVVGGKGLPCSRTTSTPGRENISVLLMVSAAGKKLPPLVIFKGVSVWDNWQPHPHEVYEGLSYAATKNGWMETEVFENFIEKTFIPSLNGKKPALIVCDGHKTHVSLRLVEIARREGLTILIIPPHSSHILQPLDLSVMKSLKTAWDKDLVQWQKHHIGKKLPKAEFVKMISSIWRNLDPAIIKNGFEKAGIVPFSKNKIPINLFDPKALSRYNTPAHSVSSNISEQHSLSLQGNSALTSATNKDNLPRTETETLSDQSTSYASMSSNLSNLLASQHSTQPSTSSADNLNPSGSSKSFQELLLETIALHRADTKTKRTKLCKGSEIITTDEAYQKLMAIKEKKLEIERKKEERKTRQAEKAKQKEDMKQRNKLPSRKNRNKKKKIPESTSESDGDISFVDSEDEVEDFETFMKNQIEDEDEMEMESKEHEELGVNDWVLTQFLGKKNIHYYVGQIIEFDKKDPIIKFLRKSLSSSESMSFKFPDREDISLIEKNDIVRVLPSPEVGRRGEIVFSLDLSNYNIC